MNVIETYSFTLQSQISCNSNTAETANPSYEARSIVLHFHPHFNPFPPLIFIEGPINIKDIVLVEVFIGYTGAATTWTWRWKSDVWSIVPSPPDIVQGLHSCYYSCPIRHAPSDAMRIEYLENYLEKWFTINIKNNYFPPSWSDSFYCGKTLLNLKAYWWYFNFCHICSMKS